MRIEQQVCTLEQGKKLKELGVLQSSVFYYSEEAGGVRALIHDWNITTTHEHAAILNPKYPSNNKTAISVFTVAELGVMLPSHDYYLEDWQHRPFIDYYSHTNKDEWKFYNPFTQSRGDIIVTSCENEAQARAANLILLLELGYLTAQEVNERLNSN